MAVKGAQHRSVGSVGRGEMQRSGPPHYNGIFPRPQKLLLLRTRALPLPPLHTDLPITMTPPPPPPLTLRVVVSTSQSGVFVMTASRALIRPSGEDAMGRSCILDSPPPPGSADARGSADVCLS